MARRAFRAAPLAAASIFLAAAPASAPKLVVAGPERVLFDQRRDACDLHDLPDAPARAFRNQTGEIVLFAPNYQNRAFVGPDLDHLKRDCTVRFAAAGNADPALLDDRTWLQSLYSEDGRNVFALASASFIPYRHGEQCGAGSAHTDCWFNGLAALQSDDGGDSFYYLGTPPRQIAFPPPQSYRSDVANPPGFMTSTNIVAWRGFLYAILWRRGGDGATRSHNCLARAPTGDPLRWELWSGGTFIPAAHFDGEGWSVTATTCDPVGPAGQPVIRGIAFDDRSESFVAIFQDRRQGTDGDPVGGFFYATSTDLTTWSSPQLLLRIDLRADAAAGDAWAGYPSLIDETSADRNFGTIGNSADLLFVRFQPTGQRSVVRQLVAIRLRVED